MKKSKRKFLSNFIADLAKIFIAAGAGKQVFSDKTQWSDFAVVLLSLGYRLCTPTSFRSMWLYVMGAGILLFATIAFIVVKLSEKKEHHKEKHA